MKLLLLVAACALALTAINAADVCDKADLGVFKTINDETGMTPQIMDTLTTPCAKCLNTTASQDDAWTNCIAPAANGLMCAAEDAEAVFMAQMTEDASKLSNDCFGCFMVADMANTTMTTCFDANAKAAMKKAALDVCCADTKSTDTGMDGVSEACFLNAGIYGGMGATADEAKATVESDDCADIDAGDKVTKACKAKVWELLGKCEEEKDAAATTAAAGGAAGGGAAAATTAAAGGAAGGGAAAATTAAAAAGGGNTATATQSGANVLSACMSVMGVAVGAALLQ